jgi:mannose-6-phosphate isomerase-like protein (cupin superfamily)
VSVTRAKFPRPISAAAVRADWKARGFSCETFTDPPGREWNDFVHGTDELVAVIEGRLRCLMDGNTHDLDEGDELFIPKGVRHSVHNIHRSTTRWLFGYG